MSNNSEAWKKVLENDKKRLAGPAPTPPNPADTRPLWERLQEEREKAHVQREEEIRLGKRIAALNEEDVKYLEEVRKMQEKRDTRRRAEEEVMLDQFKKAKKSLQQAAAIEGKCGPQSANKAIDLSGQRHAPVGAPTMGSRISDFRRSLGITPAQNKPKTTNMQNKDSPQKNKFT